MVLVSDKPSSDIGILQTKLSYREGRETRRIGLEAMPLDEHIKSRHSEGETGLEICPDAVHHLLEVANERQHREHGLHQHALLPFAALTQFEVARIAFRSMEAGVTQDNHALFNMPNEPWKGVSRDIRGGTRPPHDQPPLIEQQTQFTPDDPAMIVEAFPADLLRAAALAHGVDQLNAIRVDDPQHGRSGQESPRPVVRRPQETKEPGALGKP